MRVSLARLFVAVVSIFALLGSGIALAAPPRNDEVNGAKVVGRLPFTDALNARQATRGPGDSGCGFRPARTVWYSFTPRSDGWYRLDTEGSSYHTVLSVSTGPTTNLTQIACAHHNARRGTSRLVMELVEGTTYRIMVGGECCFNRNNLNFLVRRSNPGCDNQEATILGTDGDDTIIGTEDSDVIVGLGGEDSIEGRGARTLPAEVWAKIRFKAAPATTCSLAARTMIRCSEASDQTGSSVRRALTPSTGARGQTGSWTLATETISSSAVPVPTT